MLKGFWECLVHSSPTLSSNPATLTFSHLNQVALEIVYPRRWLLNVLFMLYVFEQKVRVREGSLIQQRDMMIPIYTHFSMVSGVIVVTVLNTEISI